MAVLGLPLKVIQIIVLGSDGCDEDGYICGACEGDCGNDKTVPRVCSAFREMAATPLLLALRTTCLVPLITALTQHLMKVLLDTKLSRVARSAVPARAIVMVIAVAKVI